MKTSRTHWRGPNTLDHDDLKSWMGRVPGNPQGGAPMQVTLHHSRLSAFINHSSFFIIIEQIVLNLKQCILFVFWLSSSSLIARPNPQCSTHSDHINNEIKFNTIRNKNNEFVGPPCSQTEIYAAHVSYAADNAHRPPLHGFAAATCAALEQTDGQTLSRSNALPTYMVCITK